MVGRGSAMVVEVIQLPQCRGRGRSAPSVSARLFSARPLPAPLPPPVHPVRERVAGGPTLGTSGPLLQLARAGACQPGREPLPPRPRWSQLPWLEPPHLPNTTHPTTLNQRLQPRRISQPPPLPCASAPVASRWSLDCSPRAPSTCATERILPPPDQAGPRRSCACQPGRGPLPPRQM